MRTTTIPWFSDHYRYRSFVSHLHRQPLARWCSADSLPMTADAPLPGASAPPPGAHLDTYVDLLKYRIIGESPDDVIHCEPRWLVFTSKNGYKNASYAEVTLTNHDEFKVAWCIKSKEKVMRVSQTHGILKGGESTVLTVCINPSDDWPRDIAEYIGKRIKIVVENLRIPDSITPNNKLESIRMSKEIFHYTATNNPLIRMFTKINIVFDQ